MRYFVTGATGFVGGRVVRQLIQRGDHVVVIVRDPARATSLQALGVEVHQGDITDRASLRTPMTGVDGVFHIAGWYKVGVRDTRDGVRINIDGTRNVLETMRELGIAKGVYTSSLAVNSDTHGVLVDETYRFTGRHLSEYDRTKWVAHYEVADPMIAQGLPLVIVQPGLIYGPGDTSSVRTTLIQYLQRKLPVLPERTAYSWAHVDDIAAGHLAAMDTGVAGENYFLAGPTHTFIEGMQIAERITGIPAPRLRISPAMMKGMAAVMTVAGTVLPVPESYSGEYLRISAGVTYIGSARKAQEQLHFTPRSLEDGLRETLAHEMTELGMTTLLENSKK